MAKVSIIVPIHDMQNGAEFLWRNINSILSQTYKDYEIIITKEGKMAENTNVGIRKARGDWIKILFLDDYFSSEYALENIMMHIGPYPESAWLITGSSNNPNPQWTDDIETGNNKLGSPSALTFANTGDFLFDESLSWLLDCDLYKRMFKRWGVPKILPTKNVIIGEGPHQMTHLLSNEEKQSEYEYLKNKYA